MKINNSDLRRLNIFFKIFGNNFKSVSLSAGSIAATAAELDFNLLQLLNRFKFECRTYPDYLVYTRKQYAIFIFKS